MYSLFLDDYRQPSDVTWVDISKHWPFTIAKNYAEFRSLIETLGVPNFVTFDHDLHPEHYGHGLHGDEIPYHSYQNNTGLMCAIFLGEYCRRNGIPFPEYEVHSFNPVGRQNIINYINDLRSKT